MLSCCIAQKFAYDIVETPSVEPVVPTGEVYNIRYNTPSDLDMAVGLVLFNPSRSKRIIMNYFYILEKLKLAGIPTYTLELTFENSLPEIQNAIHVASDSFLFHKERLCRILEQRIPSKFTKICFLDADVLFDNSRWYDETSRLLNRNEVVQPYTTARWLDLTYKRCIMERQSVVYMDKNSRFNSNYHPGFAWAFQRAWFKKIGFYELAVTGSGDTMSAAAWLGVDFPPGYLKQAYVPSFEEFKTKLRNLPRIAATSGTLNHLWHGNRTDRKYVARHECMNDISDVRKVLATNQYGVFELSDRKLNAEMKKYFDERNDDGIN